MVVLVDLAAIPFIVNKTRRTLVLFEGQKRQISEMFRALSPMASLFQNARQSLYYAAARPSYPKALFSDKQSTTR
jgi:hypothetical protein